MPFRSIALTALTLSLLAASSGCKDDKAPGPIKPAGPAGVGPGASEATVSPKSAWPAPVVKETPLKAGGLELTVAATASPPSSAEGEDGKRMATSTARMMAQQALLKAVEKRRGKKLTGAEIPTVLRAVRNGKIQELPGGAVTVNLAFTEPKTADGASPKGNGSKPAQK